MKTALILILLAFLTAILGLLWINHEIDRKVEQNKREGLVCPVWLSDMPQARCQ